MPATVWVVQALGEDIRELGRRGDADEQHLAIPDDVVGEVLSDVDVLGSLTTCDAVTPLDPRRVVLEDGRGRRAGESHTLEEPVEVQNLASRRRSRKVLRLCGRQSRCLLHF